MASCDVRFKHPCTILISGPSMSGKSSIVFKIIKFRDEVIKGKIKKVLYCLPPGQTIKTPDYIKADKLVSFHEGIPDVSILSADTLLIIDDLMDSLSADMMSLFTRNSHHLGISVIFLTQNLFFGANKFFRTVSLNTRYIICTKNPRDRLQMSTLASQIYPENPAFVKKAFSEATRKPFGYLIFDATQTCADHLRFRTNIFPTDKPQNIFFVPEAENERD